MMSNSKKGNVPPNSNVQKSDILCITLPMINRMKIEDKSAQTIKSYVRAVERLVRFHDLIHPRELEIDEVYDFLVSLDVKEKVLSLLYLELLQMIELYRLNDVDSFDLSMLYRNLKNSSIIEPILN